MTRAPARVVAYQGWPGAYSDAAARARFPGTETRGYPTFEAAVRAAAAGEAAAAVVPVRNSTTGDVAGAAEATALGQALGLVREADHTMPVRHALLARPGVALADVRVVRSHSQALAQTVRWIARHLPDARAEPAEDTAGAARDLAASDARDVAAVAHASAAARYGLAVLADGIEDAPDNATTFAVLVVEGLRNCLGNGKQPPRGPGEPGPGQRAPASGGRSGPSTAQPPPRPSGGPRGGLLILARLPQTVSERLKG